MSRRFHVQHNDKSLGIFGPFEMRLEIDFDDVWHKKVEREAKQLVRLLNKHWPKKNI